MATDLFIVIAAGFCGGVLARLLRQPLVLGYLVAGIVVGPHTGGISVGDPANLERLAEIGATLLLFGLGLELSLKDLAPVRRVALFGTPIQIALTMAVAWPLGVVAGAAVDRGGLAGRAGVAVEHAGRPQGAAVAGAHRDAVEPRDARHAGRPGPGVHPADDRPAAARQRRRRHVDGAGGDPQGRGAAGRRCSRSARASFRRLVEWVARSGSRELFLLVTMGIALGIAYRHARRSACRRPSARSSRASC